MAESKASNGLFVPGSLLDTDSGRDGLYALQSLEATSGFEAHNDDLDQNRMVLRQGYLTEAAGDEAGSLGH